VLNKGI